MQGNSFSCQFPHPRNACHIDCFILILFKFHYCVAPFYFIPCAWLSSKYEREKNFVHHGTMSTFISVKIFYRGTDCIYLCKDFLSWKNMCLGPLFFLLSINSDAAHNPSLWNTGMIKCMYFQTILYFSKEMSVRICQDVENPFIKRIDYFSNRVLYADSTNYKYVFFLLCR